MSTVIQNSKGEQFVAVLDSSGWQFAYHKDGKLKPGAKGADFTAAKTLGVAGIIHRIGNGTSFDESFRLAYLAALGANIPFGAYYYAQPARMSAKESADLVKQWLVAFPDCKLPIMLDWEEYYGQPLTREQAAQWITEFLMLTDGILYAGNAFVNTTTTASLGFGAGIPDTIQPRYPRHGVIPPIQIAHWMTWIPWEKQPIQNPVLGDWDGWQFSSDGVASAYGYPSDAATNRLDLNIVKVAAWERWLKAAAGPVTPPPVVKPPRPNEVNVTQQTHGMIRMVPAERIYDSRDTPGGPAALFAVPLGMVPLDTQAVWATVTAIPTLAPQGGGWLSEGTEASFLNYQQNPVCNTTMLRVFRDTANGNAPSLHIASNNAAGSFPVHIVVDLLGYII